MDGRQRHCWLGWWSTASCIPPAYCEEVRPRETKLTVVQHLTGLIMTGLDAACGDAALTGTDAAIHRVERDAGLHCWTAERH